MYIFKIKLQCRKTVILKHFIFKEDAHATLVTKKVNENFLHLGTVQIYN